MDWILFGNVVVVVLCAFALAAPCVAALRSLRRRPASVLAVFAAASIVATIEAQKTNGVNSLPPMPMPPRSLPPAVATVTGEDVARGWRIESVTTNETYSFAMPSDASYVGNWHVHGARSSFGNNLVDHGAVGAPRPTGWSFPLGTNGAAFSSFWHFVDGRIRPTPKDAEHEICAVGVPMSAVPGQSRLWTAAEYNDSRVLTWENFFLGGDTNAPVNAQIHLFANGDFTTRSNGVETICRRVNPHDWDGDGLANEKDENPLAYDGDFFGVANAMPTNANLDAYYQLDVAAVGALDLATIRVTCDGPSDLGDHVIIARTNQVCHVPLLAGATYAVESDQPIAYSAVSSEYANIVTNSATNLTVSLPLEVVFERIQTRGGPDNYLVRTTPVEVGASVFGVSGGCCSCTTNDVGFTWDCSESCQCAGACHALSSVVGWAGYSCSFPWSGRRPCYYADRPAIDEIEGRGISLEILDASGNAIEWKNPVLVGESIIVEATVGGTEMTVADFVGLFGGRMRLKAYYADSGGEHDILGAAIPMSAANVASQGQNVFRTSVSSEWLQSSGLIRNDKDGVAAKTSVDMANAPDGGSDRTDSDIFDAGVQGRLYGRARGRWGGNADVAIPEGEFNLRAVQAAGMACIVATCVSSRSGKRQCQQQADVFYYSGHGDHDTGKLYGTALPSDVSNRWHDVDTAVFAGCSVLDIGDQNNNYTNPEKHAASPGLKWLAASGADTLLGYAYKAPKDDQGGTAIVQNWCAQRVSLGDVEAWMRANDNSAGHNACAIRRFDQDAVVYSYFRRSSRDALGFHIYNSYKRESITVEESR